VSNRNGRHETIRCLREAKKKRKRLCFLLSNTSTTLVGALVVYIVFLPDRLNKNRANRTHLKRAINKYVCRVSAHGRRLRPEQRIQVQLFLRRASDTLARHDWTTFGVSRLFFL